MQEKYRLLEKIKDNYPIVDLIKIILLPLLGNLRIILRIEKNEESETYSQPFTYINK